MEETSMPAGLALLIIGIFWACNCVIPFVIEWLDQLTVSNDTSGVSELIYKNTWKSSFDRIFPFGIIIRFILVALFYEVLIWILVRIARCGRHIIKRVKNDL